MLGIDGACAPENVQELIRVIVEQLSKLAIEPVSAEELSRAKNMLKSMMMMQLESRLVLCEDIARQVATYGRRDPPSLICDKIESVTAEDLQKVGLRMMQSPPAVGCVGADLSGMTTFDIIERFTEHHRKSLRSMRRSVFV